MKLSSNSQNWLEHRVSNKNPKKFREPLVQFEKIDQLIITQDRIQFIMIKYINPTSQQANFINLDLIEQNPQFGYIQALKISISQNSSN